MIHARHSLVGRPPCAVVLVQEQGSVRSRLDIVGLPVVLEALRRNRKFKGRMYADLKDAAASGDADAVKKFSGQRLSQQDAQNVLTAVYKDFNSTYIIDQGILFASPR